MNPATCVSADKTEFRKLDLALALSLLGSGLNSNSQKKMTLFLAKLKGWFLLGVNCGRGAKNSLFHATPAIHAE